MRRLGSLLLSLFGAIRGPTRLLLPSQPRRTVTAGFVVACGLSAQARLETLEADLLEKPDVIGDRPAPLRVVVVAIDLWLSSPPAPSHAIGSDLYAHRHFLHQTVYPALAPSAMR